MTFNYRFRPARPSDEKALKRFLKSHQLPYEDLTADHLQNFVILFDRRKMIATIGLEICGSYGLLRSLAVDPALRGKQLGKSMVQIIEDRADREGLEALYLLTTTASEFFLKLDYEIVDRETAPLEIKNTTEFSSICPSSAVCMLKRISDD